MWSLIFWRKLQLWTLPRHHQNTLCPFDDARIRKACEDLTASQRPAAKAKKHTTKSIWYYSTAAVAGVIVLLSTFTIFGSADGNRAWTSSIPRLTIRSVVTSPEPSGHGYAGGHRHDRTRRQ